jgi:hypothetical protein
MDQLLDGAEVEVQLGDVSNDTLWNIILSYDMFDGKQCSELHIRDCDEWVVKYPTDLFQIKIKPV